VYEEENKDECWCNVKAIVDEEIDKHESGSDLGANVDDEEDYKEFWSNLGPRIDEDMIDLSFLDEVGCEVDDPHFNFSKEPSKSSQDDDEEYKLFPNYELFEFDEVEKQWKMAPIAIHKLRGVDKIESNIASSPRHVEEVNTLQANVTNMQSSACEEGSNEDETIYLPDEIIMDFLLSYLDMTNGI